MFESLFRGPFLSNLAPQSATGTAGFVGLQLAVSVFGLSFTPPDSLLRPAILPIIGATVWTLGQTCSQVLPTALLGNLVGGITGAWLTQYIVSGVILREGFDNKSKSKSKSQQPDNVALPRKEKLMTEFMGRVWFGVKSLCSQRNIGTPQQTKNVPPFKSSNPGYIPSRIAFLTRTLIKAVGSYLLLDLMTSTGGGDSSQNHTLFASDKFFSRLGGITGEELRLRAFVSIGHWIGSYLILQLFHSTLAFGTVFAGVYEPSGWPPLFGSFSDIWSLRQFWGKFYHQLLRNKLTTLSNFLVDTTLHIPPKTLIHRYSSILGTFFFSGLSHIMMDTWGVIPLQECGALQFFCLQAAGIMFEDVVQYIWRYVTGKSRDAEPDALERVVGGLWVAAWLTWTTPIWIYPGLRRPITGDKGVLLPFSVVKRFIRG